MAKSKQTDVYGNPIKADNKRSKIPFENAYVQDVYKFIVTSGNNCNLVRRAMEKRSWWIEIQPVHSMYNFKWQPTSTGIKFERLSSFQGGDYPSQSFNATLGNSQLMKDKTVSEVFQR